MKFFKGVSFVFIVLCNGAHARDNYQDIIRSTYSLNLIEASKISEFENKSAEVKCIFGTLVEKGRARKISTLGDYESSIQMMKKHCERRFTAISALIEKGVAPLESMTTETKDSGLISKGFSCQRSKELSTLYDEGCEKIIEYVTEVSDIGEIKKALSTSEKLFSKFDDDKLSQRYFLISETISNTLDKRCKTDSSACEISNEYSQKITQAKKKKKDDEKEQIAKVEAEKQLEQKIESDKSSPDSLLKKACDAQAAIKLANNQIKFQHDVAKASGVLDKGALHQMGLVKVLNQRDLDKLKNEYKAKTGKVIPLANCPKTGENGEPLL